MRQFFSGAFPTLSCMSDYKYHFDRLFVRLKQRIILLCDRVASFYINTLTWVLQKIKKSKFSSYFDLFCIYFNAYDQKFADLCLYFFLGFSDWMPNRYALMLLSTNHRGLLAVYIIWMRSLICDCYDKDFFRCTVLLEQLSQFFKNEFDMGSLLKTENFFHIFFVMVFGWIAVIQFFNMFVLISLPLIHSEWIYGLNALMFMCFFASFLLGLFEDVVMAVFFNFRDVFSPDVFTLFFYTFVLSQVFVCCCVGLLPITANAVLGGACFLDTRVTCAVMYGFRAVLPILYQVFCKRYVYVKIDDRSETHRPFLLNSEKTFVLSCHDAKVCLFARSIQAGESLPLWVESKMKNIKLFSVDRLGTIKKSNLPESYDWLLQSSTHFDVAHIGLSRPTY